MWGKLTIFEGIIKSVELELIISIDFIGTLLHKMGWVSNLTSWQKKVYIWRIKNSTYKLIPKSIEKNAILTNQNPHRWILIDHLPPKDICMKRFDLWPHI